MKKICFVTAARSEYGLLKWLMKEVDAAPEFKLQLVVTGAHLLEEQGHTIDAIREDGFSIDKVVDTKLDTSTKESIASSMGKMAIGMADAFAELMPDYVAVLGDRYELLPICNTAFVMNIPIIHISGGDVTEGAIDDGIRNAVTMLATYHFPGTMDSLNNIIRMRNTADKVWAVGEMSIECIRREEKLSREEMARDLSLDPNKKWILMTVHPETKKTLNDSLTIVENCFKALDRLDDVQIIATYANADYGGDEINKALKEKETISPSRYKVIPSLGSKRYFSILKQIEFMIGNSSSGIVEAPALKCPVINIGERQKGRYMCRCIYQCNGDPDEIRKAVDAIRTGKTDYSDSGYWGDGYTSEKIIKILKAEV